MANTTNLSIRIDRTLKDQADQVFGAMGMSITTAINVFVRQAVRQKKIPFEISLTDGREKDGAMREALEASERIWDSSARNGTDRMTAAEIDEEIAAVRKARKAQKPAQ